MKKVLKILCVVMVICLGVLFTACGKTVDKMPTTENVTSSFTETTENASQVETTKATENYYEEEETTETHYYHSAIEGCVIVEQDGTAMLRYSEKCENCGYVSSSTYTMHHSFGGYTSGFHCPDCGNNQHVEIETSQY